MPVGTGKYHETCEVIRNHFKPDAIVLLIIGGKHGHGCEVQMDIKIPDIKARVVAAMATIASELQEEKIPTYEPPEDPYIQTQE